MPKKSDLPFSVFQLQDGRHRAVAQITDTFGRTKPKAIERQTREEAIAAMQDFLRKHERLAPGPKMTVQAACDAFIIWCKAKKRDAGTIKNYERYRDNWIKPTIGHVLLSRLTAAQVEAMLEARIVRDDDGEVASGSSAAISCRAFLRAAINKVGLKNGLVTNNVAGLADPITHHSADKAKLTPANLAKILEAEKDPMRRTLWLLFADTGVRPSEGRGLMRQEVEKREDGFWLRKLSAKSQYSKKPIPLSAAVAEALNSLPASDSMFFFPSPRSGRPYNETTIRGYWEDIQALAEVPQTTLYQLRHFFGTVQAKKQKDDVLRRLMRHTDVRTTKQYYVEAFDEDLRAAVED